MGQILVPKTCKLPLEMVEFLDKEIKRGQWNGYSHAVRWLIMDYELRIKKHQKGLTILTAKEVSDGVQGKGKATVA